MERSTEEHQDQMRLVIDIIGGAVGEKAYIELNLSSEV
jgi:hypothetical protein